MTTVSSLTPMPNPGVMLTTEQLSHLVPASSPDLLPVLCACYGVVQHKVQRDPLLNPALVEFNIDEVFALLPYTYGTPTKPDFHPFLSIFRLIVALCELRDMNLVSFDNNDFEVIQLHAEFFWLTRKGGQDE